MKNRMFFNIYKSITSQHDRNDRVNRILHPIYFISLTDVEGKDTLRSYGHKLDTVYTVYPLQNGIIARAQRNDAKIKVRVVNYLLNHLIGSKNYYGIHYVVTNDITKKHITSVQNWLKSQLFSEEDILNELVHIESSLREFFAYRKTSFVINWDKVIQNNLCKDLFVYSTLDIRNGKVKFLLAEVDLLRKKYDAPTFATRYTFQLNRKYIFSRHLLYLENIGEIESYYRWIENILEQYFPKFQANIIVWQAKDLYGIIENELQKNDAERLFINKNLKWEDWESYKTHILKATTGIIQHSINEAHIAYLKFTPVNRILQNTDKLGKKDELYNTNSSMLLPAMNRN